MVTAVPLTRKKICGAAIPPTLVQNVFIPKVTFLRNDNDNIIMALKKNSLLIPLLPSLLSKVFKGRNIPNSRT
jgi:hypothetical protein